MSDKKSILSAFHRLELGAVNADFRSTLSDLAVSALGKTRITADAFADSNLKRYWNWLLEEMDRQTRRGLVPYFSLPAPGVLALKCACHSMLTSSDAKENALGRLGLARPQLLRQIDNLTDREYEALACVAANSIGGLHVSLTPSGNEGGIDFLATLSIQTPTHVFSGPGSEVRLVGQCKKYSSPVAVDRLDQFLQTMQNVRHRDSRVRQHIPAWFDDAKGPIVGWVVSHSGFQSGAADEAKKHGIVLSDSLDVAELLSLSNNFDANGSPADRSAHLLLECQKLI